jgi:hypothetical protein
MVDQGRDHISDQVVNEIKDTPNLRTAQRCFVLILSWRKVILFLIVGEARLLDGESVYRLFLFVWQELMEDRDLFNISNAHLAIRKKSLEVQISSSFVFDSN